MYVRYDSRKAKSVSVKQVTSSDVIQHILPIDDTFRIVQEQDDSTTKRLSRNIKQQQNLSYADCDGKKKRGQVKDESDDSENELGVHTAMDEGEDYSVVGKEVFKFRTVKKAGQMAARASSAANSPQTPSRAVKRKENANIASPLAKNSPSTPKRKVQASGPLTPVQVKGVAALRAHTRAEASTPYRLRKRNLELGKQEDHSSSDDSIDESSGESEDDDDTGDDRTTAESSTAQQNNMAASAEAYFDIHAMNPVTSDRTLAGIEGPRLDIETLQKTLQRVKPKHKQETSALIQKHKEMFDKWMLNMCNNYNILTYGLGSKRSLLDSFRLSHLMPFSHLVVNGYFPSLTVKHILNAITEEIMMEPKSFPNPMRHVDFIKEFYTNEDEDFYLVIHNIDGVLLRNDKSQDVLSTLAKIPGFHIIASIDHINAPFLWNENQYFCFRWLWYETTTFLPYEVENSYENSLMVQQSGGLALSSLVHVMKSLTPNAKQIFLILAEYQLSNCKSPAYEGISFQALYHQCRESFLVNSDLTLQAQLVEFKDHRLLRSKKNFEGVEYLTIPIDVPSLTEFLHQHKETNKG